MSISPTNLLLELASFRNQALSSLFSTSTEEGGGSGNDFSKILGDKSSALSSSGRNTALSDPESAYSMMTQINKLENTFKAQYAELSEMGDSVEHMEEVGDRLSDIDTTTANADIAAQLQGFVSQYNNWIDRFSPDVQNGGVLANVQAAEVSRWELETSVKDVFNGAADGVHGMGDLGLSIDPTTKRASFDGAKLDAILASNKKGAVNAIDQFSANFAKSADLLNSAGNFIPNAMNNRDRAIDYIADNKSSLQAEFGSGDADTPSGQTAKALAAYEKTFGIA